MVARSDYSLEELSAALTSADSKMRLKAAQQALQIGDGNCLPQLCTLAVSDRSLAARKAAQEAVNQICVKGGINLTSKVLAGQLPLRPLVEAMNSDHDETRAWAMTFMVPGLAAKLARENVVARQLLLRQVEGRQGMTRVGWWASLVLIELGEPQAVPALSRALDTASAETRRWILQAIGEIGYLRIVQSLSEALKDSKLMNRRRRSAALALGELGHPAALPALEAMTKLWSFTDGEIKDACRDAIQQIKSRGVTSLPSTAFVPQPSPDTLPVPAENGPSSPDTLPRPAGQE